MRSMLTIFSVLALGAVTGVLQAAAVDRPGVAAFLIADAKAEVILARSAAPAAVSADARVLVLGAEGYVEAEPGTNGFVCMVLRSWGGALFQGREAPRGFWNNKIRAPICYNPAAAASQLPRQLSRARAIATGESWEEIVSGEQKGLYEGSIPVPRDFALAYMMSSAQHLGDRVGAWKPHLMIYSPYAHNSGLGGHPRGGDHPFVLNEEGGPFAVIVIPVADFVVPVGQTGDRP